MSVAPDKDVRIKNFENMTVDQNENTVLLVHDAEETRSILSVILESAGYPVLAVPSAADALSAVRERRFPVILVDLYMPEMDGAALITRLRSERATARMPIILMTAIDGASIPPQLPFDAVLMKPFATQRLLDCLTNVGCVPSAVPTQH